MSATDVVWYSFTLVLLTALIVDTRFNWRAKQAGRDGFPIYWVTGVPIYFIGSASSYLAGHYFTFILFALFLAIALRSIWEWWKNRKNRKKRPSRVLSRVKNLGHRLAVAPVKS